MGVGVSIGMGSVDGAVIKRSSWQLLQAAWGLARDPFRFLLKKCARPHTIQGCMINAPEEPTDLPSAPALVCVWFPLCARRRAHVFFLPQQQRQHALLRLWPPHQSNSAACLAPGTALARKTGTCDR